MVEKTYFLIECDDLKKILSKKVRKYKKSKKKMTKNWKFFQYGKMQVFAYSWAE